MSNFGNGPGVYASNADDYYERPGRPWQKYFATILSIGITVCAVFGTMDVFVGTWYSAGRGE